MLVDPAGYLSFTAVTRRFSTEGIDPDRCAVSYLLEKSSFAVAREKTILIRSERLGRDKDSRDKRHSGGVQIACHGWVESQSVRKIRRFRQLCQFRVSQDQ